MTPHNYFALKVEKNKKNANDIYSFVCVCVCALHPCFCLYFIQVLIYFLYNNKKKKNNKNTCLRIMLLNVLIFIIIFKFSSLKTIILLHLSDARMRHCFDEVNEKWLLSTTSGIAKILLIKCVWILIFFFFSFLPSPTWIHLFNRAYLFLFLLKCLLIYVLYDLFTGTDH